MTKAKSSDEWMYVLLILLLIIWLGWVWAISVWFILWGVLMSLCLLILPWIYENKTDKTSTFQRIKNFRSQKIRLIVSGVLCLPILIALTTFVINNIQYWIEERKIEAETQIERERQEVIAEDKRNTPKPEIIMITDLNQVFSWEYAKFSVQAKNATQFYYSWHGVWDDVLGSWIFEREILMWHPEETFYIEVKNKYWTSKETFIIKREMTEDEIEFEMAEQKAEEELEAYLQSPEYRLQQYVGKKWSDVDLALMCKMLIEDVLVSPSSVKYPRKLAKITVSQNKISVSSYLDAQNRFGAMVRNNYKCVFRLDKEEIEKIGDLVLDDIGLY